MVSKGFFAFRGVELWTDGWVKGERREQREMVGGSHTDVEIRNKWSG